MTNWISVKDRLPKHRDKVIAYTIGRNKNKKGIVVSIYVENEQVYQDLKMAGIPTPDPERRKGGDFCSQEIIKAIFWMLNTIWLTIHFIQINKD